MPVMKETNELPFKDRYAAILKAYDYTPSELAAKLGKPVAPFYKYKTGEIAMPRKDVLEKMLLVFHGLRREYLFHGEGNMKSPTFIAPPEPVKPDPIIEEVKQENERLRKENEDLRAQLRLAGQEVKDARKEVAEMTKDLVEITKLSFNGSSSQFTAMIGEYQEKVRQQIGFRQTLIKAMAPKVDRFHPGVRTLALRKAQVRIRLGANA